MQAIEIFRIGKHTATNGQTFPFDQTALSTAVSAYDPKLHEAPVVIGHPKDNHPAFGWIDHLELTDDGVVLAHPKQVDADFAELVRQGKYKKRSASWYLPDSPNNPKPGTLYLRHVGFLGAMPPALKGLKDVKFNEAEQGVVEFGDTSPWVWSGLAGALRSFREWIIGKDGVEAADKIMPSYVIDDMNSEAERMRQERINQANAALPSFTEPQESTMLTAEQIAALQAENAKLKANADKVASFAEQEKCIKARELALVKNEIGTKIDALVGQGKVLAAQKPGLIEFMAGLEQDTLTVEFGEGAGAKKVSPRQFMLDYLESMPKLVDFEEHSKGGNTVDLSALTAAEFAEKITAYQTEMSAKGITVSTSQAAAALQAKA